MDFSEALVMMKDGKKIKRTGWNSQNQWLHMQVPDQHSKMSLPYIYIKNAQDKLIPWIASQGDIFGEDWIEFNDQ